MGIFSNLFEILPIINMEGVIIMAKRMPPEVIEKIKKKEEEVHRDNRIPLYLPDDTPTNRDPESDAEETSGIIIIDLVD